MIGMFTIGVHAAHPRHPAYPVPQWPRRHALIRTHGWKWRNIAVVTGNRAEYGLLRPVIAAIQNHRKLNLRLLVTGTHLFPPESNLDLIKAQFPITETIPMQLPGQSGRLADGERLAAA